MENPNFGFDFGEAALKFSTTGQQLRLVDWFEPDNGPALDASDTDVGSSGLTLIPNTDLLVGGGKQGVFYLLNSSNLGHEQTGNGQIPQVLSVSPGLKTKGGPVYWQSSTLGQLIYSWNQFSYLEAYHFNGATFDTAPVLTGAAQAGTAGAILTLSAHNENPNTGIIWASMPLSGSPGNAVVPGIIRAYNAETLEEIWNSQEVPSRDSVGTYAKFVPPLVVNGKVYMATFNNAVVVYGLLPEEARQTAMPSVVTSHNDPQRTGQNLQETILSVLHAYDARNIATELYNSNMNPTRDAAAPANKFAVPTVMNGKVYVGTQTELDVYGLLF
jgi:hypothetical protein